MHNPEPPLVYPEDVDKVLDTWEERTDSWFYKEIGRVSRCGKYGGPMVCIDEYSHEGNITSG